MSATTAVEIQPVSWEVLTASESWKRLTPNRRVWLCAFIANGGDAFAATRTAYRCKSEKNAKCMAYELRKHPDITAALEFYRGGISRDEFLAGLRETIRRAVPGSVAQVRAQSLLARMVFGVESEPTAEPSKDTQPTGETSSKVRFKVDDIATLDGKQYRVTAIREDGTVSEADPL